MECRLGYLQVATRNPEYLTVLVVWRYHRIIREPSFRVEQKGFTQVTIGHIVDIPIAHIVSDLNTLEKR